MRPRQPAVVIFTNAWMMGGMEQNLLDLGRALVQRRHRVGVMCFAAPAIEPLRRSLREAGVDVYPLVEDAGVRGRWRRLWQVVRILRRYPQGVLHLDEGWPAGDGLVIVAALLARVRGIVRTEHQP